MFISCEPCCPLVDEECTLHLCIKNFCPKDVLVSWTKDEDSVLGSVFNTPPSLNITGLYSMFSFLRVTPRMDDQGSVFRCRVVHSAQREPEERTFIFPKPALSLTDSHRWPLLVRSHITEVVLNSSAAYWIHSIYRLKLETIKIWVLSWPWHWKSRVAHQNRISNLCCHIEVIL